MEDENVYCLFRNGRKVVFRESDLTVDKICRIFQVTATSVYITDDSNQAIFPETLGAFNCLTLRPRGHYEVHGVGGGEESPHLNQRSTNTAAPFTFRRPSQPQPSSSGLHRPVAQSRIFQRSISIGEVVSGKICTCRSVIIRFTETEANVEDIKAKVKMAIEADEDITLADSQGNEILDSDGTRTSTYWKQNSRKIFALFEGEYTDFITNRRTKTRRRGEDEVIRASESLTDVADTITKLADLAKKTMGPMNSVMDALSCLVCKEIMSEPMLATCCSSLIGCSVCVEQWREQHDHCLKCRASQYDVHKVKGLSPILSFFKN